MSAAREVFEMEESAAQLGPRVAKVEAEVTYISSRVTNIEIDLRDMRKSMDQKFDATSGEFKTLRAEMKVESNALRDEMRAFRTEMSADFKAFRSEMSAEFKAFRSEMSAEFKAVRAEAKEESTQIRGRLDRLWDRVDRLTDKVTHLQIAFLVMAAVVLFLTKGAQSLQVFLQWLSHFR